MKSIILFGDSIFFGVGATSLSMSCGRILKDKFRLRILIKGRVGDTTKDAIARIRQDVLIQKGYRYVFILFGNNDCRLIDIDTPIVSLKDFRRNLIFIVEQIRKSNKFPIISNLQPIDQRRLFILYPEIKKYIKKLKGTVQDWQKRYSVACEEVAYTTKTPLLDIRKELNKNRERIIAADGIHINDYGHRIVAAEIFNVLKGILKSEGIKDDI